MNYPFVKCLHPKKIINPYTKESLTVPCGHCKACVLSKSSRSALYCSLESSYSKYCHFITLTYNNDNIPLVQVVPLVYPEYTEYHLCDSRTGEFYTDVPFRYPADKMEKILAKANFGGCLSYAPVRDLQLFIKRIRKYFQTHLNDEKVRYYAVSEYGPVTFRAHFHVLLFHNSDKFCDVAREVVRSRWPLGFSYTTLSAGGSSSYVAGYVNSYASLPRFYSETCLRPFSLHSRYFAMSCCDSLRSLVYETRDFSQLSLGTILINSKNVLVEPSGALLHRLFPKCYGYGRVNSAMLYFRYTAWSQLCNIIPALNVNDSSSVSVAARLVTREFIKWDVHEKAYHPKLWCFIKMLNLVSDFGPELTSEHCLDYIFRVTYERIYNRVYSVLRLSYHFHSYICLGNPMLYSRNIDIIRQFWDYREKERLLDFYYNQEVFLSDCDDDVDDVVNYFYFPERDELYRTHVYTDFLNDTDFRFRSRIKHKRLNDLNDLLLNS